MKTFKQVINEQYDLLVEGSLNSKEDLKRAIALWKNLSPGKKASEAKKIIKAAIKLKYPLKQKDILKYKDSEEVKATKEKNIDKEIDNKTYTPKLQKETQNVISDLMRYNIIDEEPKEREKILYNYIILGKNDFDVAKKDKEFYDFFKSQKMSIEVERYSDFYNIRYIAVKIINIIEDYINNDEFDGDIYSIMKDYWQNYRDTLGNYLHSKTFDGVFKLVNKWYEKYK